MQFNEYEAGYFSKSFAPIFSQDSTSNLESSVH